MLLPPKVSAGVADGSITLAFRRWRAQDVKPGATFKSGGHVIRVDKVSVVDPAKITDADARRAGLKDAADVRKRLAPDESWKTYKVTLGYAGPDPRIALRESAELTDADVAAIDTRLERLDKASSHGAWTMRTLELIRQNPQRRAPDLAAIEGRETAPFKIDVRKLKGMGLTVSFPVGYEISARGLTYLQRTKRR
ncbi:hypothetical protein [Nocardioides marmorisolisilvae]|uniref:ASCH domain-containing protein n=1 Tax=Nocardioides marmorisolisilvae TaxID=1542737 RepID=A0A3N0DPW8_9ACTN|nr:hypothetical protein [Nocardioides marmorisolisilvae]RNL77699.1 hypothetical protein EFL95_16985 [Nocardioides marmorisolisilvae]